jgi:hypothetical protein
LNILLDSDSFDLLDTSPINLSNEHVSNKSNESESSKIFNDSLVDSNESNIDDKKDIKDVNEIVEDEFIIKHSDSIEKTNKTYNCISISKSPKFIKMVQYLCNAFRRLQETYESGNVILALQFYINILEDGLKGSFDEARLPRYILEKEYEYENLLDYNKIKNFWTVEKIDKICDYYEDCFSILNDNTMSIKMRRRIAHGKLNVVNSILKVTDEEFQELIRNSRKG